MVGRDGLNRRHQDFQAARRVGATARSAKKAATSPHGAYYLTGPIGVHWVSRALTGTERARAIRPWQSPPARCGPQGGGINPNNRPRGCGRMPKKQRHENFDGLKGGGAESVVAGLDRLLTS